MNSAGIPFFLFLDEHKKLIDTMVGYGRSSLVLRATVASESRCAFLQLRNCIQFWDVLTYWRVGNISDDSVDYCMADFKTVPKWVGDVFWDSSSLMMNWLLVAPTAHLNITHRLSLWLVVERCHLLLKPTILPVLIAFIILPSGDNWMKNIHCCTQMSRCEQMSMLTHNHPHISISLRFLLC